MQKYHYGYQEFILDTQALIKNINWEFDTIIGVARGGLTLSHILGEHYDIRDVYTINTIGYDGDMQLENIEIFNIPNLKGTKRVLIVDDIVDSGNTLKLVIDTLNSNYPEVILKSASLFYKKGAIIKPNWYIRETDSWIDFFWSTI